MKVMGFFSGLGAMELGFQQAGFEIVASNEIDPIICKTLETNFKHPVICKSIHKISIEDIRKDFGRPNGIIGGFPCTVYSTAADIQGTRVCGNQTLRIAGEEKIPGYSRFAELGGALFLDFFRVIANLQPDFFVVENVPGILAARIVRETFANMPCGRGGDTLGRYYKLFEGILNARNFGLPQNRPRYFFVGSKWDGTIELAKSDETHRHVVGDILEDNPEIDIPDYVYRRLEGAYRDKPIITEANEDAIAPTCVAHYAKDRGTRLVKIGQEIRPYTTREYARLQGIPDDFEIAGSDSQKYLQVGNGVAVPVAHAIANGIKQLLYAN